MQNRPMRFSDNNKIKEFVLFNLRHNKRGLVKVLHSEGFVSPRTEEELLIATVNYLDCDKADAVNKIMDSHPHFDFIIERAIESGYVLPTNKLKKTVSISDIEEPETNNNNMSAKTSRIINTETDNSGNKIITQELINKTANMNKLMFILVAIIVGIYLFKR